MKKLLTILFLFSTLLVQAQNFEGIVRWSMKSEITDPKMKAQMEEGIKQMNDPANQAKMKQMMDQMNNPQMKAMMDANPQMKEQMESAMKMMQGGNMASLLPTGFILKVKGMNSVTIMEGGMAPMEILHLYDQNKSYELNRAKKTYRTMSIEVPENETKETVKVSKTTEKMKVLNHTCTKYIATIIRNEKSVDQIFWTTTEISDFDMKKFMKHKVGDTKQSIFYEGIEGVPLRIEMITSEAKMIMEAQEIKRQSLSASDFAIPSDFTETKFNYGR
jgi:hypothetical protein